jgi:hypothetical protein
MADRAARELESIKRLLVLLLLKLGATSDEIGVALAVDASAVRRMIPAQRIKRIVPK